MQYEKRVELARRIGAAEHLFHRHRIRKLLVGPGGCTHALTPAQVHMVMSIHERGSMTIKQLTQVLCVKPPAASAMVDRLVEMGLLTRVENPSDRREVLVGISPDEEAHIQEIERNYLQLIIDLCEKMGDDHAERWGILCDRLQEVLEEESSD